MSLEGVFVIIHHHKEILCRNGICSVTSSPSMRRTKNHWPFFKVTTPKYSYHLCYYICLIFFYKHHLHLPLFSLNVMAFPACTYRPAVREHHWVSARGVGFRCLGLCTLQIGKSFVLVFNHGRLSFFWKLLWMINHWRYIYSRWSVCCTESVTLKHTRTCTCNVGKCHACTTHRRHTLRRCEYFLLASPNL